MDLVDQRLHDGLGQVPERQGGEVGESQVEDARGEAELPPVRGNVAELGKGEQDAARAGPGEPCRGGDLGERHRGALGAEGANDRQPPRERLDVCVARDGDDGRFAHGRTIALRSCDEQ